MNVKNDSTGPVPSATTPQQRTAMNLAFAAEMRDLETDINDAVNMSFLAISTMEAVHYEAVGLNGAPCLIFSGQEEQSAMFFAFYETDLRIRELMKRFYAATEKARAAGGMQ